MRTAGQETAATTACTFQGQTKAAIRYAKGGSQVPTLLVSCRLEPAGDTAVDLTTERGYAGVSLVDCVVTVKPGGVIVTTAKKEALFLENTLVQGAAAVCTGGAPLPGAGAWTLIERFSSHTAQGVNLLNGVESTGDIAQFKVGSEAPDFDAIRRRHYRALPSFQDPEAVNVQAFGAKGDGTTDDTQAFATAIRAHDKIFLPKGHYHLAGTLALGRNTQLFGLTPGLSTMGGGPSGNRPGPGREETDSFVVSTPDDRQAAPVLSMLNVQGRVD